MRRVLGGLMALMMLVAGCTAPVAAPPAGSEVPDAQRPPSTVDVPATASPIVRTEAGWEAPGLKHAPVEYLWSPDQKWVAFNTSSGLWAVSPDGAVEHRLVAGDAWRELAGWWQGGLVYLEHRPGGEVVVGYARPGEPSREVVTLPFRRAETNLWIQRHAVYGDHLALFADDQAPVRVHLVTGAIQPMAGGPLPSRCVFPGRSPDGRYLVVKNSCEPHPVYVADLGEWRVIRTEEAGYLTGADWSPSENTWAALGGASGPYAAYLDLGDPRAQVRRLHPPQPLKLIRGPYWTADGAHLAVVAEVQPASNSRGRDAVTEVWLVTPATGAWRKLGRFQFVHVVGWHPSGRYLVLQRIVGSAAPPDMGLLPASGGEADWLPHVPIEQQDPTRLDERLIVVGENGPHGVTAYLPGAGGRPPLAVRPGQVTFMDGLQIRPPYASWHEYRPDQKGTTLVVVRRP